MGLLERLGLSSTKTSGQPSAQLPEPITIEKLLEPLRASKNVGDVQSASSFLNQLLASLRPVVGNNISLLPNIPGKGEYKGYLIGIRMSSINDVYDGRAAYDSKTGYVNFNLVFNQGAEKDMRNAVGAIVYPLFGLEWTPPAQDPILEGNTP